VQPMSAMAPVFGAVSQATVPALGADNQPAGAREVGLQCRGRCPDGAGAGAADGVRKGAEPGALRAIRRGDRGAERGAPERATAEGNATRFGAVSQATVLAICADNQAAGRVGEVGAPAPSDGIRTGRLCVEPMLCLWTGFEMCLVLSPTNSRPRVKPAAHQGWFALPYIVAEGWRYRTMRRGRLAGSAMVRRGVPPSRGLRPALCRANVVLMDWFRPMSGATDDNAVTARETRGSPRMIRPTLHRCGRLVLRDDAARTVGW